MLLKYTGTTLVESKDLYADEFATAGSTSHLDGRSAMPSRTSSNLGSRPVWRNIRNTPNISERLEYVLEALQLFLANYVKSGEI